MGCGRAYGRVVAERLRQLPEKLQIELVVVLKGFAQKTSTEETSWPLPEYRAILGRFIKGERHLTDPGRKLHHGLARCGKQPEVWQAKKGESMSRKRDSGKG